MAADNKDTVAGGIAPDRLRPLYPTFDRFEARDFGSLGASLALHFVVFMGLWATAQSPRTPRPMTIDVEIIQAEPIQVASKATLAKSAKLARESNAKPKPPKPKQQKTTPAQDELPEVRDLDAKLVKAGKRGGKGGKQAAKVVLPDVSQPAALDGLAVPGQTPDQAAGLQQSQQRGTLKPRLPSVGQQASTRMQEPARAGVESEAGPRLIASSAPAAQSLVPEYRHSSSPGGKYSSQGGAAQPAMGGGPASEASQAYSLQSSTLAGSRAGDPAAPRSAAGQVRSATRGASLASSPDATSSSKGGGRDAAMPMEILSAGGQSQTAVSGAPLNPMQINSAGGTAGKTAAAGGSGERGTGGDVSLPGSRLGSRGLDEGAGQGQFAAAGGSGRSAGATTGGAGDAVIPSGGGSTVRPLDTSSAAPLQRVKAQAVAQVITDRYAAKEMKVSSPKSVCELPLMMAGLDRKPLPEGLASIMGSESAMVMETPPFLLPGNLQPTYPASAVFSQLKGKAVVRVQVLSNGLVGEAFIRQSSGAQVLDQAALATVRSWRFRPAHRNGEPVPAWVNVPIEYRNPS